MNWRYPPTYPEVGESVVAELEGLKNGKFVQMTIRYGEGLGHIVKWIPTEEWNNNAG